MLDESNIDFELQKQLEDFETRDSSENGSVDSNWNSHLEASRPSNHVSASRPNSITARLKIRSRRSVTIDDLSDEPSPIAKRGLLDFMGVGSNRQTTPPPRGSPFTFGSTKLKDLSSSERSDEMDLDDLI